MADERNSGDTHGIIQLVFFTVNKFRKRHFCFSNDHVMRAFLQGVR